jgi:hypothetical protein
MPAMSQFAFLHREWPEVFAAAARMEAAVRADPRTACFYARRALELPYQTRGIRRIAKAFERDDDRKALLVIATGAGKPRTVIALADLLSAATGPSACCAISDYFVPCSSVSLRRPRTKWAVSSSRKPFEMSSWPTASRLGTGSAQQRGRRDSAVFLSWSLSCVETSRRSPTSPHLPRVMKSARRRCSSSGNLAA